MMCGEFNDHWVEMAMADDSLVAHLLLSFNRPESRFLDVQWTIRQRRSLRGVAAKKAKPARASPMTPLSWSSVATTSASGAADGSEDSSRPTKSVDNARSKADYQSETATATAKRPKKRTLPELSEKEKVLLEERRDLKNQLATWNLTVEKHRVMNQSLKRLKVDLDSRQSSKIATTSLVPKRALLDLPQLVGAPQSELASPQITEDKVLNEESLVEAHQAESVSAQIAEDKVLNEESLVEAHQPQALSPQIAKDRVANEASLVCTANASSVQQENGNREPMFFLPDLNEPLGEDFDSNDVPKVS